MYEFETDITVVGAGIAGLNTAYKLADNNRQIMVLESNIKYGQETSSHNSQVIHGGFNNPPDFLKTILCIRGKNLTYEMCEKNNIPYRRIGKIVAATNMDELASLERLYKNGIECGVTDLKMLTKEEVLEKEPYINSIGGIWSPSTGIFDTDAMMDYLVRELEDDKKYKNVDIAYGSTLTGIRKVSDGYELTVLCDDDEEFILKTNILINCAGLNADKVAEMVGIDIDKAGYRQHYCKGEYFRVSLSKSKLLKHLVYPHPTDKALGIHAVIDLDGGLKLGPNAFYINRTDYKNNIARRRAFYTTDETHWKEFYEAKLMFPFIEPEDLSPDTAGIRPKLQGPGEGPRDFFVHEETDRGLPGFYNIIGWESPGATAGPALGEYLRGLV